MARSVAVVIAVSVVGWLELTMESRSVMCINSRSCLVCSSFIVYGFELKLVTDGDGKGEGASEG